MDVSHIKTWRERVAHLDKPTDFAKRWAAIDEANELRRFIAALPSDAAQAPPTDEQIAKISMFDHMCNLMRDQGFDNFGDVLALAIRHPEKKAFHSIEEWNSHYFPKGAPELPEFPTFAAPVAPAAAATTLLGSPAEGSWGEPETPSDGHRLESDVDEEAQPDERAAISKDAIREIFMAHGFTIKEGQVDLKQYVYDAAYALLARATAPQAMVQVQPGLSREEKRELILGVARATPIYQIGAPGIAGHQVVWWDVTKEEYERQKAAGYMRTGIVYREAT